MEMQSRDWWGESRLEVGQIGRFAIGPLTLYVQRLEQEWRVAHVHGGPDDARSSELPAPPIDLLGLPTVARYVVSTPTARLELRAALADRPVVTRPERPLVIAAGEQVRFYVRTPLWAQVCIGSPGRLIAELPVVRPSDTWFGPITEGGELCYASNTFFRLSDNEGSRPGPHRATTAVLLSNRATSPLALERLSLPVAHLALYAAPDGQLWTDDVAFERTGGDDYAAVRLPEPTSGGKRAVSPPRQKASGNLVLRAFNSLFT